MPKRKRSSYQNMKASFLVLSLSFKKLSRMTWGAKSPSTSHRGTSSSLWKQIVKWSNTG